ncbi:MAG: T9SS type A sorting domain-containing protein [Prevotella sp.]|nr:T9SS type A sorting domain-containing protein [Prevotella sp.]
MTRKLFLLIFSAALLLGTPVALYASQSVEIIDNDFQNINISVNETTLRVTGASGQTLFVYNVAGVRVMSVKIEGADKLIELNLPKGCYIVKVGKVVRKISIK